MADVKDDKKFTKEEVDKLLVDKLEEAKLNHFNFTLKRSWAIPSGSKICPQLDIVISGGNPTKLDGLALKIQELLIDFQKETK